MKVPKMVGNVFFPMIVALTGKIKLCKVVKGWYYHVVLLKVFI